MSRADAPRGYEPPRSIVLTNGLGPNGSCYPGSGASDCSQDGNGATGQCSTGLSASGCQYSGDGAVTYCTSDGLGFD